MKKYDLHLSAYQISNNSIKEFEKLGFCRDEFANNTRCEVTSYHGTYRGEKYSPNSAFWNQLYQILEGDYFFSGGLEEEEFDTDKILYFDGLENIGENRILPPIYTEQPKANLYKACDIHISVDLEKSDLNSLQFLEALEIASFDKPKENKIFRIYTITTETLENGEKLFAILSTYLKQISCLVGKIKLERTTRFFRKPADAKTLPMVLSSSFDEWLNKLETYVE